MLRNLIKNSRKVCEVYELATWTQTRFAGHSKWQNIRHIKGAKDAERSALFTKLSRQIKVAIQEGGSSDVLKNSKLEQVIDQAKRANMPAASIQNVIKTCESDKSNCKSYMLEFKGPGSCIILCEIFTDKAHMVRQNIATQLRKHNCKFTDGGGKHLFQEKGIIEATLPVSPENKNLSPEQILDVAIEHAVEAGAEDVRLLDDGGDGSEGCLQFSCGATSLKKVVTGLEQFKYQIHSASVELIPTQLQELDDSSIKVYHSLVEKLENMPEVVRLYDNIAN